MNSGQIVQIVGPVVDMEFPLEHIPQIYDALNVESENDLALEVRQQLGDGVVRPVALGSSEGLKRGFDVVNTGVLVSVRLSP